MPSPDWGNRFDEDSLVWHIPMHPAVVPMIVNPDIDPPQQWVDALAAVVRDLGCLQHGSEFRVDRLVWELTVDNRYEVSIGWTQPGSNGFWSSVTGLSMDAPVEHVAVWVADATQDQLLKGMPVAQWPSKGWQLLVPKVVDGAPFWVDPHGDVAVSPIGALCDDGHRWK